MTAHFLIDAWRFRCGVFRLTQFDLSLRSGKAWGAVVENFFRPSESVTDGGSFDSVRLTPHSAHDDRRGLGLNAGTACLAACGPILLRSRIPPHRRLSSTCGPAYSDGRAVAILPLRRPSWFHVFALSC